MYNQKIYVAPEIHHQQTNNFYHPYSTLTYQSYSKKPTYLEHLASQKYYGNDYYYEKEKYPQCDRQLFQIQKEQHYDFINKMNKNLEFDFKMLKDKIETLSISYIEERELFQQMVYEIHDQLFQIEKLKSNLVCINFDSFNNSITTTDLLDYLHKFDFTQIRKCDLELFFNHLNLEENQETISKLSLRNLIGKEKLTKQQNDEQSDLLQARLITMIIQAYTALEFYRQKFAKMALKLDLIFNWLDFDRDGILSHSDFKSRFPNQELVYKFLTQQSIGINDFVKLLQPHSKAKYF